MAGSLSSSTPSRTDSFDSPVATPLPLRWTIGITIGVPSTIALLFFCVAWLIKRHERRKRQQPHTNGIPLNPMGNRREGSDRSEFGGEPTEHGVASTEDEGSQSGTEVEGSPVVPVGPLDTGASETPVGPIFQTPSDIAAPDVAPDNNPLRTEVEGSQVGADVEGPSVSSIGMDASETPNGPTNPPPPYVAAPDVASDNNPLREPQVEPVGPMGMGASETPVGPINPTPSGVAAPDVAPDNNPLREPQAALGSWHDPNLGNL